MDYKQEFIDDRPSKTKNHFPGKYAKVSFANKETQLPEDFQVEE